MPLRVNKQAISQLCDKASLASACERINAYLLGIVSDSQGRILYCTPSAALLNVPRGTNTLQDLASAAQKDMLLRAFDSCTHACICLHLRKSAYATVEYVSGGVFICYIFTDNKAVNISLSEQLLYTSFSLEYVKTLPLPLSARYQKELCSMLQSKLVRLSAYINASLSAQSEQSAHTSKSADLNVFIFHLINYINEFADTLKISLNYNSNRHANVNINTGLFAKVFCAAISFLTNQPQTNGIPVDVKCAEHDLASVYFMSYATCPLQTDNAYFYFLLEITQHLGWKIDLNFDQNNCQSILTISIPLDSITGDTLHNPDFYPKLCEFLDDTSLKEALSML